MVNTSRIKQLLTAKGCYVVKIDNGSIIEESSTVKFNPPEVIFDIMESDLGDPFHTYPCWKLSDCKRITVCGIPMVRYSWIGSPVNYEKYKNCPSALKSLLSQCNEELYQWALNLPVIGKPAKLNYDISGFK